MSSSRVRVAGRGDSRGPGPVVSSRDRLIRSRRPSSEQGRDDLQVGHAAARSAARAEAGGAHRRPHAASPLPRSRRRDSHPAAGPRPLADTGQARLHQLYSRRPGPIFRAGKDLRRSPPESGWVRPGEQWGNPYICDDCLTAPLGSAPASIMSSSKRADQRRGSAADQGTDRPAAPAMRQVGAWQWRQRLRPGMSEGSLRRIRPWTGGKN
jgi:hypothetical protein